MPRPRRALSVYSDALWSEVRGSRPLLSAPLTRSELLAFSGLLHCPSCGEVGIGLEHRSCPACGGPTARLGHGRVELEQPRAAPVAPTGPGRRCLVCQAGTVELRHCGRRTVFVPWSMRAR